MLTSDFFFLILFPQTSMSGQNRVFFKLITSFLICVVESGSMCASYFLIVKFDHLHQKSPISNCY